MILDIILAYIFAANIENAEAAPTENSTHPMMKTNKERSTEPTICLRMTTAPFLALFMTNQVTKDTTTSTLPKAPTRIK